MGSEARLTRRGFIGVAAGAAAATRLPKSKQPKRGPTKTYDVVIVGSGAAGMAAALSARKVDKHASIVIIEERPFYGGTSYRSGGRIWIPNNAGMRADRVKDPKDMCLKYMARCSYPEVYNPSAPNLGLAARHYAQLNAYYDNGAPMMDYWQAEKIMPWVTERGQTLPGMTDAPHYNGLASPDYHAEYEENVANRGRSVMPHLFDPTGATHGAAIKLPDYGTDIYGPHMVEWLHFACLRRNIEFHSALRATDLLLDTRRDGTMHVSGVRATTALHGGNFVADPLPYTESPFATTYRARRGVIFATGGFSKDPAKVKKYFTGNHTITGGGCANTSATGDFTDIALRYGFPLENMDQAWFIENIYEQYLLDPDSRATPNYLPFQAYWLNGDSTFLVNRRGVRVTNEKQNYHDRTQAHFHPDNQFLFGIFDEHTLENFVGLGGHIIPSPTTWIGPALTTAGLTRQLRYRIDNYAATKAFGLAPDFQRGLDTTLARFAGFARSGKDKDFGRGDSILDTWWHAFCLSFHGLDAKPALRNCIDANVDENGKAYPNPTMRPLKPPYYAVILSSGMQDTKGGPAIDEHARVIDKNERPVDGLYGAGNCIGSPAGKGYWGEGGTLGPAMVFGHIAGAHAGRRN